MDYLDGVSDRMIPELEGRPLRLSGCTAARKPSCRRTCRSTRRPGSRPCSSGRARPSARCLTRLCNDRRTLLWFANQRAVEYHPALVRAERPEVMTHLVLDLDPPSADAFKMAVRVARLVRQALTDVGLDGAVKTSGAKGLHVFIPIKEGPLEDAAAATRAIAARAEALEPGVATTAFMKEDRGWQGFCRCHPSRRRGHRGRRFQPSHQARACRFPFPVTWDQLDDIVPAEFNLHSALRHLGKSNPWAAQMPAPQTLSADLVAEGHAISVGRVQAMHEGKRRARARRARRVARSSAKRVRSRLLWSSDREKRPMNRRCSGVSTA